MKSFFWFVLVASFLLMGKCYSQIPRQISYQGVLVGSSGLAVPDGSYSIRFNIFPALDAPLGEYLWRETHSGVSVIQGTFKLILGSSTSMDNFSFDRSLFLELTVLDGPNIVTPITFPRSQFTAVPYAIRADTANALKAGAGVRAVNSITDSVRLVGGNNVTITPVGNTIEISASGGGGGTLPFPGTVATVVPPLSVVQNGTGGGLSVTTNEPSNSEQTVSINTNGAGGGLSVRSTYIGQAGYFEQTHASNPNPTLEAINNNGLPALRAFNYGLGFAGYFRGINLGLYLSSHSTYQNGNLTIEQSGADHARIQLQNNSGTFWTIGGMGASVDSLANMKLSYTGSSAILSNIMTLQGNRRVGVNTETPQSTFDVAGKITTDDAYVKGELAVGNDLSVKGAVRASQVLRSGIPVQPGIFNQVWFANHDYGAADRLYADLTHPIRTIDCPLEIILEDSAVVLIYAFFSYEGLQPGRWAHGSIDLIVDDVIPVDKKYQIPICAPTTTADYYVYMYPASKTFYCSLGPGTHHIYPRLVCLDVPPNPGHGVVVEYAELTAVAIRK